MQGNTCPEGCATCSGNVCQSCVAGALCSWPGRLRRRHAHAGLPPTLLPQPYSALLPHPPSWSPAGWYNNGNGRCFHCDSVPNLVGCATCSVCTGPDAQSQWCYQGSNVKVKCMGCTPPCVPAGDGTQTCRCPTNKSG